MNDTLRRIKMLYDTSDISPTNLQPVIGVAPSAFSEWKKGKGKPSVDSIKKIAKYFNVSIDWIVFGEDGEPLVKNPFKDPVWIKKHNAEKLFPSQSLVPQATDSIPAESSLTDEEKDVLFKLRVMDDATRAKVMGYMDALYSYPKRM